MTFLGRMHSLKWKGSLGENPGEAQVLRKKQKSGSQKTRLRNKPEIPIKHQENAVIMQLTS